MTDDLTQKLLSHQRWLDGYTDGAQADISGVDFTSEDLSSWDFRRIIARNCNFTSATMPARMQGGNFAESIFQDAFMDRSAVEGADFTDCDLRGASMYYTVILNNATITGAKFSDNVVLWMWARMMGLDFSGNAEVIQTTAAGLKTALAAIVAG